MPHVPAWQGYGRETEILEPIEAIKEPLRQSLKTVNSAATLHIGRPDPNTPRPYGRLTLIDEPRATLRGLTEATLQLSVWGALWEVEEISEAVEWLDGHSAETENMRGGRYVRQSRGITEDADLEGVWQLTDILTCTYLSISRLEAMPP